MYNIMLDLETLSLKPNAAVIQIALQGFGEDFIPDENYLCVNVDREVYDKHLFDFDDGVVSWWDKQPKEVIDSVSRRKKLPGDAVKQTISFLEETCKKHKDVRLWSNHLLFDVRILDNMVDVYEKLALRDFIKYYHFMDYATYRNMFVDVVTPAWIEEMKQKYYEQFGRLEHDALSDCRFQIFIMKEIQEALYG